MDNGRALGGEAMPIPPMKNHRLQALSERSHKGKIEKVSLAEGKARCLATGKSIAGGVWRRCSGGGHLVANNL